MCVSGAAPAAIAAAATTFQDLGSRPPLSPSCSASSMLGLSVPWLLSSAVLSHTLSCFIPPPYPTCDVVSSSSSSHYCTSTSDHRAVARWWSPFAFQDVKLSPNDLKYLFFLLPHFFFAQTKYQTLKGQSGPAKCSNINKMSRSCPSPNVVVLAFIAVAPFSLPPSSLSSLSSLFILPVLWLLQSSFHSHSPYTNSRRRQQTMTYDDDDDDDVIDDGGGGELAGT